MSVNNEEYDDVLGGGGVRDVTMCAHGALRGAECSQRGRKSGRRTLYHDFDMNSTLISINFEYSRAKKITDTLTTTTGENAAKRCKMR